jgi:hypothetical protein
MQSAIASGHHGVLFSLKKVDTEEDVVWSKVSKGALCQTYDKTGNGLHTIFYVPGLRYMEKSLSQLHQSKTIVCLGRAKNYCYQQYFVP